MDNRILIEENWQERIRDKIGAKETYLPDSAIEQPDIISIAESNIIAIFPDYESLEGDSRLYFETAIVLECCILLCPSMGARLPKKSTGPHAGHELWINWEKKREEFMEERDSYIGKIMELEYPELQRKALPWLTVTYPKRGW